MAKNKKVHWHDFEIQIKSNNPNEKSLKWELTEALNYYFSMRNYLMGDRTSLNKIKVKINGKNTL